MTARVAVALVCLLLTGCGLRWPTWLVGWPVTTGTSIGEAPTAAPVPEVPTKEPPPPVPPVEAPKPPPAIAKVENGDRVKRITAARSDLKVGLTALRVRAVTACTEPGEACVDNQALIDRARALDKALAAALLDPQLAVDWAAVTAVLRVIVDSAMKGAPK